MGEEEEHDLADVLEIRVENVSGDLLTTCYVPGSFTCVELNQQLLVDSPLPTQKEYKFIFEGKTLKPGLTLLQQGIVENATLSALTQRKKGVGRSGSGVDRSLSNSAFPAKSSRMEKAATWNGTASAEESQVDYSASVPKETKTVKIAPIVDEESRVRPNTANLAPILDEECEETSNTAKLAPILYAESGVRSPAVGLEEKSISATNSVESAEKKGRSEFFNGGMSHLGTQKMPKASEILQQVLKDGHEYMMRRLQERLLASDGVELAIDNQLDAKLNEAQESINWNSKKKQEKKHEDSGTVEVSKKHLLVPNKQLESRGSNASHQSQLSKRSAQTPSVAECAKDATTCSRTKKTLVNILPADLEKTGTNKRHKSIFPNTEQMKNRLLEALDQDRYSVTNFYHDTGIFQHLARHPVFEQGTLAVIGFNALWIAYDTDQNKEDVLIDSEPQFIIMENLFCLFFFTEWFIRFMAFKEKKNAFKDGWFVFDLAMVCLMVTETWVMALFFLLVTGREGGFKIGNAGILKLFKLLRLARMGRIARLLRAVPEVLILLRAMFVAFRSVFFTLCLLMVIIYVFAIALVLITRDDIDDCRRLQLDDPWVSKPSECINKKYFEGVFPAMFSLLLAGNLPDHERFAVEVWDSNWLAGAIAMLFIFLAPLTVMGMLIGVLVEVVKVVSAVEKETMDVEYVKDKLLFALKECDYDGGGLISRDEFEALLPRPDIVRMLNSVDVDVVGIAEFVDFIFENQNEIPHATFIGLVLQLRGRNRATVKDLVDLRRYTRNDFLATHNQLNQLSDKIESNQALLRSIKSGEKQAEKLVEKQKVRCELHKEIPIVTLHEPPEAKSYADVPLEALVSCQDSVLDPGDKVLGSGKKKKKVLQRELQREE